MNFVKLYPLFLLFLLIECRQPGSLDQNDKTTQGSQPIERVEVSYSIFNAKKAGKDSLESKFDSLQLSIIMSLNRIDMDHLINCDSIIIPSDFVAQLIQYSPFPASLPLLNDIKKFVLFSYFTQSFAVYNSGVLVHWGPTNMGSKKYPSPTGIYYANWKAEETKSTFNDEWDLKWNVNLDNKEGIGWHQYTMPGFPASHSCFRLLEADAKYLYDWVDEWVLLNKENIVAQGTPTLVFGSYPFGGRKPWLKLLQDPHSLDISEQTLANEVNPCLPEIKKWEIRRDSVNSIN